jgi:tripartite-type tricarboxylate transporter receptor subunit TctC
MLNPGAGRVLRGFFAALSITAVAFTAQAQGNYPDRPIKLVVPFPAGGATDLIARTLGQKLGEALGQPVVVENKPGAAAALGTDLVAKSPPDGYTLVLGISSSMVVGPVYTKVPYDPVRDFAPIAIATVSPFALVVHPSVPAKSVRELVALAKEKPGELNVASFGSGSSSHLTAELFKAMAGVNLTHVPYKGGPPALQDLIAGRVQVMFDIISSVRAHMEAGRLRALAVTGPRRSPVASDVPTVAETLPGFESSAWFGILAPAGTPDPIIRRLNKEIVQIVKGPALKELYAKQAMEPVGSTPEEFAAVIKADLAKWAKVIKDAGIKPE